MEDKIGLQAIKARHPRGEQAQVSNRLAKRNPGSTRE